MPTKKITITVTTRMQEVASLCGLSPMQWACRRLSEAANADLMRAHDALIEAKVRDRYEYEERARAKRERFYKACAVPEEQGHITDEALAVAKLATNKVAEVIAYLDSGSPEIADKVDRQVMEYRNAYYQKHGHWPNHLSDEEIWQVHLVAAKMKNGVLEHRNTVVRKMKGYHDTGMKPVVPE